MFNSTRGNSLGISKKILCVIMTISLSLMMLPSALFRTEAQAASPTNDDVFVKADSDMTNFGQFAYNPNSNAANISTYTQNDLLHAIGCKAETEITVKEQAEAQLKAALTKNLYAVIDDVIPAYKEGAILTLTSVTDVVSELSCLQVSKVPNTTNWRFATSDPGAGFNGNIIVKTNMANLKSGYEIALRELGQNLKAEILINEVAAQGKVVVTPTAKADTNGNTIYSISSDIYVKNLQANETKFGVSVVKDINKTEGNDVNSDTNATVSFDLSQIITESQPMMTYDKQCENLKNIIVNSEKSIATDSAGTTVYLGVKSLSQLISSDYKISWDALTDIAIIENSLSLYTDPTRETETEYEGPDTLSVTNLKFNVSAPQACDPGDVLFYDGDDHDYENPVSFIDLSDYYFNVNKTGERITVASTNGSKLTKKSDNPSFSDTFVYPVETSQSSSLSVPIKLFECTTEGIIKKLDTKIKYRNSENTYLGYEIMPQDTELEFIDYVRMAGNFFFSKQSVRIKFTYTPASQDDDDSIKSIKITDDDDNHVPEGLDIGEVKTDNVSKNQYSICTLTRGLDNDNSIYEVDLNYWKIRPYDSKDKPMEKSKEVSQGMTDPILKVIANAPVMDKTEITWDGTPANEILTGDQKRTYSVTVEDSNGLFQYTIDYAKEHKDNELVNKDVITFSSEQATPEGYLTSLSKKISDFEPVSGSNGTKWELIDTIVTVPSGYEFDLNIQFNEITDMLQRPAKDSATTKSWNLRVDALAPRLFIDWTGGTTPVEGGFYNKNYSLKAVVKVVDLHFKEYTSDKGIKVVNTREDEQGSHSDPVPSWSFTAPDVHDFIIAFNKEGHCHFDISGTDEAGLNLVISPESPWQEKSINFTTDYTIPVITSFTWDNNAVVNGMYYTSGRTAYISVHEFNFDKDNSYNFPNITGPGSFSGWTRSGDSYDYNGTISCLAEGDYAIVQDLIDRAGNTMAGPISQSFTIDWTKPNIQISGVENRQAYGDAAQPNVTISDANMSGSTTCQVESLGATKGHPYSASPATSRTQYTYSYANPERVPENDGVYRINVNAVDMAGNGDVQERVWSVNRFGSTYVIDAETEKIMDGYVNKDSIKDIIVTEINPSGVENHSIDMTKGSFTETLNEGSDYTAAASGGDGTWYECVYTIKKDFFKEDGKYTLNYISKDKAGNENENTMENKNADRNAAVNVQFMYDNTKPTVSFDNLSEGLYAEANHKATANFEDNSKKFSEAKVIINGEENYVSGDDMDKKHNAIDFELKDSGTPYTIEAVAIDKAGNEMDKDVKTVVVTMNPFLLWFYNTPLFVGSLVGAGVIVAGVLFFLYRRGLWIFKK